MEKNLKNIMILCLLLLASVVSCLYLADWWSKPSTLSGTVRSIDEKTETVLKLTATSTLASAAISTLPDDAATPIAEKLADFTEYFLLILVVLYSEKYLAVITGTAAFRYLIPALCLLTGIGLFWKRRQIGRLLWKVGLLALAFLFLIPASIKVSDVIYDSYRSSISATISSAESLADSAQTASQSDAQTSSGGLFQQIKDAAASLSGRASQVLNRFVEALAVMIVTTCIIPLLVLVFFIWCFKIITGIDLNAMIKKKRGAADTQE